MLIGGRASYSFAGQAIPVEELLVSAVHEQLRVALPGYEHTVFDVRVLTTPTEMLSSASSRAASFNASCTIGPSAHSMMFEPSFSTSAWPIGSNAG